METTKAPMDFLTSTLAFDGQLQFSMPQTDTSNLFGVFSIPIDFTPILDTLVFDSSRKVSDLIAKANIADVDRGTDVTSMTPSEYSAFLDKYFD
jgi:alkyl hydroperoxide reductase subunit AhpC